MPKLKKKKVISSNFLKNYLQICGILSRKRSGNGGYLKSID